MAQNTTTDAAAESANIEQLKSSLRHSQSRMCG